MTNIINESSNQLIVKKEVPNELMNTRIEKKNSYSKEDLHGLCGLCDWFIQGTAFINITDTNTPKLIFLSAIEGSQSIHVFVYHFLPRLQEKVNLIIASEDNTFPHGFGDVRGHYYWNCQIEISILMKSNLIDKIFVENLDSLYAKCYPIPLGFLYYNGTPYCNTLSKEYNLLFQESKIVDFQQKSITLFCCHRLRDGPQWEKRRIVKQLVENEWKDFALFNDILTEEEYMNSMKNSKFTLCVQGGGYDPCPRCWQAILCGSIPIIEHSPLDSAFERLPVVFIDSWQKDNINLQLLSKWENKLLPWYIEEEKRKKVLDMLSLQYWYDSILKLQEYEEISINSLLVEKIKKHNIIFTYGSNEIFQNVTYKVYKYLFIFEQNQIYIDPRINFNLIFGDSHFYKEKTLNIYIPNKDIIRLKEIRTEAFFLNLIN